MTPPITSLCTLKGAVQIQFLENLKQNVQLPPFSLPLLWKGWNKGVHIVCQKLSLSVVCFLSTLSHWQIERGITNTKSQNIPPKLSVPLWWAENGADTSLPHVAFLKKDSHITELAKIVNKTEYFQSHLSNFHETHTFFWTRVNKKKTLNLVYCGAVIFFFIITKNNQFKLKC